MADDDLGSETPKEKKKREKAEAKTRKAKAKQEKKFAKEAKRLGISLDEYRSIMEVEMGEKRAKRPGKSKARGKSKAKGAGAPKAPAPAMKGEAVDASDDDSEFEEVIPWSRQSAEPLDEVEKRIDRMSGTAVKSLKDRYADKYGEDLTIPDLYQAKLDEMDGAGDSSLYDQPDGRRMDDLGDEPERGGGLFGRFGKRGKKDDGALGKDEKFTDDVEKEPFFSTDESFWHLGRWWPDTSESGILVKIIGGLFGVLVYIIMFVPRIIPTLIIRRRRKKEDALYAAD